MFSVGRSVRDFYLFFTPPKASILFSCLPTTLRYAAVPLLNSYFSLTSTLHHGKMNAVCPITQFSPFFFPDITGVLSVVLLHSVRFHELVCLLYEVHLAHIAFLQKRIDFVKQITRYHCLKIAARCLTLLLILFLVFAVCHPLRCIFLSRYHFIPLKIFLVYILYYILQAVKSQGSARRLCLAGHGDCLSLAAHLLTQIFNPFRLKLFEIFGRVGKKSVIELLYSTLFARILIAYEVV